MYTQIDFNANLVLKFPKVKLARIKPTFLTSIRQTVDPVPQASTTLVFNLRRLLASSSFRVLLMLLNPWPKSLCLMPCAYQSWFTLSVDLNSIFPSPGKSFPTFFVMAGVVWGGSRYPNLPRKSWFMDLRCMDFLVVVLYLLVII